jgi:hypothetical protein
LIFLPHLNFPERVTDLQARRKTLIELADEAGRMLKQHILTGEARGLRRTTAGARLLTPR